MLYKTFKRIPRKKKKRVKQTLGEIAYERIKLIVLEDRFYVKCVNTCSFLDYHPGEEIINDKFYKGKEYQIRKNNNRRLILRPWDTQPLLDYFEIENINFLRDNFKPFNNKR